MGDALLLQLEKANRPEQFELLEEAAQLFTASSAVSHLLVRGSLAVGTADRLSDVDFVVGVEDGEFLRFVSVINPLMRTEFGGILPGWRDTIVGDMGGIGYVFLIGRGAHLQQVDLYAVPASMIGQVHEYTVARPIFVRDPSATYPSVPKVAREVERMLSMPRSCTELLIEALVVGYLIRKRINRRQDYIAYAETHLFNTAAKNLIKTALAPTSRHYGWYQLEEEIGCTPIGRKCLADLAALISVPGIPTIASLDEAVNRVIAIAERAAPDTVASLEVALEAYRRHLGMS